MPSWILHTLTPLSRWVGLLAVCLLAACDTARVHFDYQDSAKGHVTLDMVRVQWLEGTSLRSLKIEDLLARKAFTTHTTGDLRVWVQLVSELGDTVASGGVKLDLRKDWEWGIIIREGCYPVGCFGCEGDLCIPLEPAHQDSVVDAFQILWGGAAISDKDPPVY